MRRVPLETILSYILAFLLTFPVFLGVGGTSPISLAKSIWVQRSYVTLPASAILTACLLVWAVLKCLSGAVRLSSPRSGIFPIILVYTLVNTLSLILGMLRLFSARAILFYIQVISPASLYFLGVYFMRKPGRLRSLFMTMLVGGAAAGWGLLIQSIIDRGLNATLTSRILDYIGPFYIWGIAGYFPLAVAYVAVLGLALFFSRAVNWRTFILVILPVITLLPLIWSKGAVLTFVSATVLIVALIAAKRRLNRRILWSIGLGIILIIALFLAPTETIVVQRLKLDVSRGESISLSSRMERWAYSAQLILRSPLIGVGFSPELGGEGATGKVFRSHNQYLDLWFKAGVLPLLVFLVLAGQALGVLLYRYNHASTRFERGVTLGVLVGWVVVLGVSNLQQNNFAQPYTGNMLWFTLGLVEGYFAHRSLITQMPNRLSGSGNVQQVKA